MSSYASEELDAIYELGKLYYEMGYFAPAERVFNGLAVVDKPGATPAHIALGVIKLELGSLDEAVLHFRQAFEDGQFILQAKLGLAAVFISRGDHARAKSILVEIANDLETGRDVTADLRTLWEAFALRCEE